MKLQLGLLWLFICLGTGLSQTDLPRHAHASTISKHWTFKPPQLLNNPTGPGPTGPTGPSGSPHPTHPLDWSHVFLANNTQEDGFVLSELQYLISSLISNSPPLQTQDVAFQNFLENINPLLSNWLESQLTWFTTQNQLAQYPSLVQLFSLLLIGAPPAFYTDATPPTISAIITWLNAQPSTTILLTLFPLPINTLATLFQTLFTLIHTFLVPNSSSNPVPFDLSALLGFSLAGLPLGDLFLGAQAFSHIMQDLDSEGVSIHDIKKSLSSLTSAAISISVLLGVVLIVLLAYIVYLNNALFKIITTLSVRQPETALTSRIESDEGEQMSNEGIRTRISIPISSSLKDN